VGLLVYYTPVYQVFGLKFVVKTKACCSSPRSQKFGLKALIMFGLDIGHMALIQLDLLTLLDNSGFI